MRARVPVELKWGPFTVEQAARAGLTRQQLRGRSWRRLLRGTYVWVGLGDDPLHLLWALHAGPPACAAFSGPTAAWLHGLDLPPDRPVEVTIPVGSGVSNRVGVRMRRGALPAADVIELRGLPVTTPLGTAFDLARHQGLTEAVVAADMALHGGLVRLPALRDYVAAHPTPNGIVQARRVVGLAEPRSESPMETRLRLALVRAGLPRPQAQAELAGTNGRFIARVDLYYPAPRLAIEYDGGTHRDSLIADDRRQNRLLAAGYRLLRFTATDLAGAPAVVAGYVR